MTSAEFLEFEKIIIFDNVIIGNNHLVINSGIINTAQKVLEEDSKQKEILFIGDCSHTNILSEIISNFQNIKVSFRSIKVINPGKTFFQKLISWFKKLYFDRKNLLELIRLFKEDKSSLLIISLISFNLFCFFTKIKKNNSQQILVLLHGEVEYLFQKTSLFKNKLNSFFLSKALCNLPQNTKLIVFSDLIKNALIQRFDFNGNQVIVINHPIKNFTREDMRVSNCVTFSHLGVANRRKNSELIFKLSKSMASNIENGSCRFSIIGRIEEREISNLDANVVLEANCNKSLTNDLYWELISKIDYSLIFLTDDEYVYRVSGSLLDSIQFQIPIIALKQGFISELFDKGGDIGFLCKDFDEMVTVVRQISLKNPKFIERYSTQVSNLKRLSEKYHFENAALIIKAKLAHST